MELVGGGSVISGPTPSSFSLFLSSASFPGRLMQGVVGHPDRDFCLALVRNTDWATV